MRLVRLVAAALVAAVLAVLAGGPALAHNSLVEAVPKKDAKLTKAPEEVRLQFLQKLDARYTTIVVTDAQKQKVPASAPEADGKVGSITFAEPLANGIYTVAYRVVSQDGHPVQGAYTFTVNVATASPSPSATTASPAAAPSPVPVAAEKDAEEEGSSWWLVPAVIGAVVLVGAVVALTLRRRRPQ